MKSWSRPDVPSLPGTGTAPRLLNTATGMLADGPIGTADLYVCGITPYDATHIGHAATYLAYDTLIRAWLDAGLTVRFVQNVTDVDDPLLERAASMGVDWKQLAGGQIDLFRGDMQALSVIPPDDFVAVTEVIEPVAEAVQLLVDRGVAYRLGSEIYFDSAAAATASPWHLGQESRLGRDEMLVLSAERGGDPERAGKRDPLDPVLWWGAREGEPSWSSVLGRGRPGWHIECSVIAQRHLDLPLAVNGGGNDLIFPHHEFTAGHTAALTGTDHARVYAHAGLVSYQGAKMSKSLGNLVFVSRLLEEGTDPRAIRLAILAHHYRADWEWTDAVLATATERLAAWAARATIATPGDSSLLEELRAAVSADLDTPTALAAVDRAAYLTSGDLDAVQALLGIDLRS